MAPRSAAGSSRIHWRTTTSRPRPRPRRCPKRGDAIPFSCERSRTVRRREQDTREQTERRAEPGRVESHGRVIACAPRCGVGSTVRGVLSRRDSAPTGPARWSRSGEGDEVGHADEHASRWAAAGEVDVPREDLHDGGGRKIAIGRDVAGCERVDAAGGCRTGSPSRRRSSRRRSS